MRRSRLRTALLNAGTALVAVAITLAAVEIYFRLSESETPAEQRDFPAGHFPRLNSYGLRDVDYGPKTPGTYRILAVGDSFTFGSGVEDDAAIWPAILERRLAEIRPLANFTSYELLNAGIAGSLTDQWVAVYQAVRQEFQPDLVLVVFFLRDGTRFEQGMNARMGPQLQWLAQDPLVQLSATYRYFAVKGVKQEFGRVLGQFYLDSYAGNAEQTAEWRVAQSNLLTLAGLAAADGARFGIATFPLLHRLDGDPYPFQVAMDAVESFCRANGIAHLSLLPAFRGRRAEDLWVSDANQHPNPAGHRIAADALLPFVRELMAPAK